MPNLPPVESVSDEEYILAKDRLIYKGLIDMIAYMINDYYICMSYEEVSSLIHDILHYSILSSEKNDYTFYIRKGILNLNTKEFISDCGQVIALYYESLDDLYYKVN